MCSLFIVHLVTKGIKKIHENKISIPCKADGSKDRQNIVFSGNIVANITTTDYTAPLPDMHISRFNWYNFNI
jgi:hypothetical protein